jgi:prolyl-tRNA editing enzyme YbaK/EbsC (Cys-tRNA(Pro) deacylase)
MSRSADRVAQALGAAGIDAAILEMPESTRTAAEAAAAVGCDVAQIVKSLVFASEQGEAVLVLVSGIDRVDEELLALAAGSAIKRAGPDYVRERTGFAIGGVPPLGHREPLRTLVDERLLGHEVVWAAGGTPRTVFAVSPAALVRATGAGVVTVAC